MFSKDHNEYLWVFLPGLELKLLLTKQEQLWFHIKQIKNKKSFCHFFISLFMYISYFLCTTGYCHPSLKLVKMTRSVLQQISCILPHSW